LNNVKLTKQSFNNLINRHPGAGRIFIHSGTNEVTSFDFWLGRNGHFYATAENGKIVLLSICLDEYAKELHRQEKEQDL